MGNWIHRISNINQETRTANCENCGLVNIKKMGNSGKWRCRKAWNELQKKYPNYKRHLDKQAEKKRPYRKHRKPICERCGFIPEDECQLDVHHLDGDHKNDAIENLQTLCANCHRLITKRELC